MEQQISAAMATVEEQGTATNAKLDAIAEQLKGFQAWMQAMDTTAKSLTASASLLQLHAEDAAARLDVLESPATRLPDPALTSPPTIEVRTDRPDGHGGQHHPRGPVLGDPRSSTLPPNNGTPPHAHQLFDREFAADDRRTVPNSHRSHFGSTPKMDFPKFDGGEYQVWIDNCELYFDIYSVPEMMKVKFASLNCVGNAALWLKMVQKRRKFIYWHELRDAVREKWGRNKHKFLMRQLLLVNQTGSVDEYTLKFDTLKHQILLADPNTSEVLFVERYLAGLRAEIRSVVILHQPEDMDTASSLALLQEVELENEKQSSHSKTNHRYMSKTAIHSEKNKTVTVPEESRKMSEKLEALRSYRKAKNLCFTCGDPWARGHKCPDKVPLHIMEELLEVLHLDEPPDPKHLSVSRTLTLAVEKMSILSGAAPALPPAHEKPSKNLSMDNSTPPPVEPTPTGPHAHALQAPTPTGIHGTNPGKAAPASFGASSTAKISVDASLAGAIIGRGGATIKQISRASGARLRVRDHDWDADLKNVELEGTFDQIKNAYDMAMEQLIYVVNHDGGGAPSPAAGGNTTSLGGGWQLDSFKTKLCGHFARGCCTHGDGCRFAHGESELRRPVPALRDPGGW